MSLIAKANPRNWTLFVRTQALVGVLVVLLLLGFAFVMAGVQELVAQSESQADLVDGQRTTLARQSDVLQQQKLQLEQQQVALADQLQAVQVQQQTAVALERYPAFLFWRLASTASLSSTDIGEGDRAEVQLRDAVQALGELDEELAEAIDVFLLDLDDFNTNIERALEEFEQGNAEQGQRIVQSTQSNFISMNTMMEVVAMLSAEAVVAANGSVTEALGSLEASVLDVERAAAEVADGSESLIGGIETMVDRGRSTQRQGWLTAAVVSVLFILVGFILSRSVSQPVLQLEKAIKRIDETADLTQRVHLKRRDEVGRIAKSFNNMLTSFSSIVQDVRSSAESMAGKVSENSQANESIRQILDRLNTEVDLVAAAINELSATVRGINEHTTEAANRAMDVETACRNSSDQAVASGEQVTALEQEIRTASGNLNALANRTKDIHAMVDVIQGVSEQTNLLALNAAIEAARAGEQGRGFAVVADEVRTLARKTEQSSEEIKTMVAHFSTEVGTTVAAMQRAVESAASAGTLSASAGEAMRSVVTVVGDIRATNEHISQATQEQAEATDSIDNSVTSIATLIAQVAEQAQQTVAGVRTMAEDAERLREQADRFKV